LSTRSDVVAAEALAADDASDRGKRGWKWSLFTDRNGIPVG
jgi:hypothetical protein